MGWLNSKMIRQSRLPVLVFAILALTVTFYPKKSYACGLCVGSALTKGFQEWFGGTSKTVLDITGHVSDEFTAHRGWIVGTIFEDNLLPAMMLMTEQLTVVAMQQTMIIGQFMDAKHQMETQQVFQRLAAQAHKDYHPSIGVCVFGSGAKSLAASERKSEYNAIMMSQHAQDRGLGNVSTAAYQGEWSDRESRLNQFRRNFCNVQDNNNALAYICDHDQNYAAGPAGATDRERMNKDIDYLRTVDAPWTLQVDFTDTGPATDNEEEVLALASNLYGEKVFVRPPSTTLRPDASTPITDMQKLYMDMRSILAKRSVAENSFNAITAMKSEGAPGSREYLMAILDELGIPNVAPNSEVEALLGANPSYYAQMEVLTKKIFQNPDFYTNLYDKPANVTRKGLALQAVGLMQKFDLFKSYLRTEANMSVLLELAVMDLQEEVENDINQMTGSSGSVAD